MKLKSIIGSTVIGVATLLTLSACNDVDNDNSVNPGTGNGRYTSLVTYTGNTSHISTETGQMEQYSTFEYLGADGTVSIAETTYDTAIPADRFASGQRMMINYDPASGNAIPYPLGTIFLKAYKPVPTVNAVYASAESAKAYNAEMPLRYEGNKPAITRTGNYINFEVYMAYSEDRSFEAAIDQSTLDSDMPDIYLTTKTSGPVDGYKAVVLASVNIAAVWNNPQYTGVNIHINNTAGNEQKVFTFNRQ